MAQLLALTVLAVISHTIAAPQSLISFGKNGEVGVNFGGYHASAGLGGFLSGGGIGGLHAEAGTPHGQAAKAGLGGSFGEGGTRGGLYAGATAGGGTQAAAGLEGSTGAGGAAGKAYSVAQAGSRGAAAGLGGETSDAASTGYSFTASKSFNAGTVVKQAEIPPPVFENTVLPEQIDVVKHKKVAFASNVNVQAPPAVVKTVEYQVPVVAVEKNVNVQSEVQSPIVYKEYRVHKPRIHYKPRHHFKTWGSGYFRAGAGEQVVPAEVTKVVHKEVQVPVVEKRIDVAAESSASVPVDVQPAGVGYSKRVTVQKNPQFFADIFNIPIQTLSAVSKLLGNAASGTSIAVEKSGYAHADATPGESVKSVTSQGAVQIKTPSVTSIIDNVFAIPINTLGAVNQFLQNNVPVRKTVQLEGGVEGAVGGRAWRRAARRSVIIREEVPASVQA